MARHGRWSNFNWRKCNLGKSWGHLSWCSPEAKQSTVHQRLPLLQLTTMLKPGFLHREAGATVVRYLHYSSDKEHHQTLKKANPIPPPPIHSISSFPQNKTGHIYIHIHAHRDSSGLHTTSRMAAVRVWQHGCQKKPLCFSSPLLRNLEASATQMAFGKEGGKERGKAIFSAFSKRQMNLQVLETILCLVAADGQNLSSKGRGSEENQTGRDRKTDRQTQRQRWMPVPTEVQARCMSSFHRSLLPLRGVCVCTGPCHWGCLLQALRRPNALRQFCLDKDCRVRATGSLPSDTLIEGENELVRFSVAGDEGEESKGEKEERRGAG